MPEFSFAVVVYDDIDTADQVFDVVRELDKQDDEIEIKEAAVLTRKDDGRVRLNNKGFIGTGKGGVLGLVVGAILGGPLAGLVIGGLIGFVRSGDRRDLKRALDEKLGANQSALAIVIKAANWEKLRDATDQYGGEVIHSTLSDEALATLETMQDEEDIAEAKDEDAAVEETTG